MNTNAPARQRRAARSVVLLAALPFCFAVSAFGQESGDSVRVPTSHANVHKGPSSGRPVLVLAPEDTVLQVIGRQGEWLEVELEIELRETGMVVRWYEDEKTGWMHESTVELVEEGEAAGR